MNQNFLPLKCHYETERHRKFGVSLHEISVNMDSERMEAVLRVLSPMEQSYLTLDAQALIYKYRSQKWLSPRQLEELITEVVTIARMRQVPSDGKLVDAILHNMGDIPDSDVFINADDPNDEQKHLLN